MNRRKIHENYHKTIKLQKRVINERNFTYITAINLLNKYLNNSRKILDVGCGTGTLDFYLVDKGHHVVGIDISNRAINYAKQNSIILGMENSVRFKVVDFPDEKVNGKFDGVLISEVLEHLRDDSLAVKSIRKVLVKNGIVIASSPSTMAPLFKAGVLEEFDKRVGHLRRYTDVEYKNLFKKNGFKVIRLIKTEGIIRNFLFTNSDAGKLIRYIRWPLSDLVTILDNLTVPLFGESNYYIVARKL